MQEKLENIIFWPWAHLAVLAITFLEVWGDYLVIITSLLKLTSHCLVLGRIVPVLTLQKSTVLAVITYFWYQNMIRLEKQYLTTEKVFLQLTTRFINGCGDSSRGHPKIDTSPLNMKKKHKENHTILFFAKYLKHHYFYSRWNRR